MDRPFQTFRQHPYSSAVDFLHEIRSICENAFDLHQNRLDPVNGVAKDVHDFIHELLEEQERLKNGELKNDFDETNFNDFSTNPTTLKATNETTANDLTIAPKASPVNLLLLNEVLLQRKITSELGIRLIQILTNETERERFPSPTENSKLTKTWQNGVRTCWEQPSDSDEDITEEDKEISK